MGWENCANVSDDGDGDPIQGAGIGFGIFEMSIYRPSPRLVAANAALAHWLARHPDQRKESPAVIVRENDDGRQGAAAPREEERKPGEGGWK